MLAVQRLDSDGSTWFKVGHVSQSEENTRKEVLDAEETTGSKAHSQEDYAPHSTPNETPQQKKKKVLIHRDRFKNRAAQRLPVDQQARWAKEEKEK